jgi:hypothetical protein
MSQWTCTRASRHAARGTRNPDSGLADPVRLRQLDLAVLDD